MISIIAECGLNHTSLSNALEYCDKAKEVGADIIKFQTTDIKHTWQFNSPEYVSALIDSFGLGAYLEGYIEEMILKKELSRLEWLYIKNHCDKIGIEFLSTPSSKRTLKMLMDIGMKRIKIASNRVLERSLIDLALSYRVDVIMSNGMHAVNKTNPYIKKMFCVSKYPSYKEDYDFTKYDDSYDGFSDHTVYIDKEWCKKITANHNLKYYEKHFTLDDNSIDAKNSLKPSEFKILVDNLRSCE
jgi:sialic acid synthase SpsE